MSLMSPCPEVLCCCHPFLRLGRFGRTHLHPCIGLSCFHCWQGGHDMRRPRHSVPGSSPSRLRRYWSLLAESFQDYGERLGRAIAVGDDLDRVTDVLGTDVAQDSVDRGHRFVVDGGDDIPSLEPDSLCAGPGCDLDDVDALGDLEVVLLDNRRRESSSLDA